MSPSEKVWRWLRKQGPAHPREAVLALRMTQKSVSSCLTRLREKGCVERRGKTWGVTYSATATRPEDMRGTAVNTLRALQRYSLARPRGLRIGDL